MENYIEAVTAALTDQRLKRSVEAELTDHIEEKTALYLERGFDADAAAAKANEAMGESAEEVGRQLGALHPVSLLGDILLYVLCVGGIFLYCVVYLFSSAFICDFIPHTPLGAWQLSLFFIGLPTLLFFIAQKRRFVLPSVGAALLFAPAYFYLFSQTVFLCYACMGRLRDYLVQSGIWWFQVRSPLLYGITGAFIAALTLSGLLLAAFTCLKKMKRLRRRHLPLARRCRAVLAICLALYFVVFAVQTVVNLATAPSVSAQAQALPEAKEYPEADGWVILASDLPIRVTDADDDSLWVQDEKDELYLWDLKEKMAAASPAERAQYAAWFGVASVEDFMASLDTLTPADAPAPIRKTAVFIEINPGREHSRMEYAGGAAYTCETLCFTEERIEYDRRLYRRAYHAEETFGSYRYYKVFTVERLQDDNNRAVAVKTEDLTPGPGDSFTLRLRNEGGAYSYTVTVGE